MGVNTFLVGADDPGGWRVADVARAGGEPIPALGLAAHARLSHDRGLATLVGFLRGYAWFVVREGRAPGPEVHAAPAARGGSRARAVYGPAPDRVPERWPHLLYTHPGGPDCFVLPQDFPRPRSALYAPSPPEPGLDPVAPWRVYLCSAPRLLLELEELAAWLPVDRAACAALEALEALEAAGPWDLESVDALVPLTDPFGREKEAWLRLRLFAQLAARHGLVVTAE
ncbi:MAG: hypothetical protein R3F62_16730 [Planctomycetota bacterium]